MLDVHASSLEVRHLDTPRARASLRAQAAFFFRQTSPQLLLANACALVVVRALVAGVTPWDGAVLLATAAWWPLQEWLLHKHVLHVKPRKLFGRTIDPLFAREHRAHHMRPWLVDKTLLPPLVILALIPLQVLAWTLALPLSLALTAATTYAWSALLYEWTHYLSHASYAPRTAYFQRIVKNHRLHHYKSEQHWFSFTVPHVDAWLGTDPPVASVPTSETVRTLGVEPPTSDR